VIFRTAFALCVLPKRRLNQVGVRVSGCFAFHFRRSQSLYITFEKAYRPISPRTISRMAKAGT
jgi:hypothetical protein